MGKHFQFWGGHTSTLGLTQRFLPDGLQFDFATVKIIDQCAGFVCPHFLRAGNHVVDQRLGKRMAKGIGCLDDLLHQITHKFG